MLRFDRIAIVALSMTLFLPVALFSQGYVQQVGTTGPSRSFVARELVDRTPTFP